MANTDANHNLYLSSPNPTSSGNNQREIKARPGSPLSNASPLSRSSSNISSSANNEKKKPMIRFVLKEKSPPSSSPNPPSSGKNENESEINRNASKMGAKFEHESKESFPKNLMSPTNSTTSKPFALKKKILSEWTNSFPDDHPKNPSNLSPKSSSLEVGASNSALKSDDIHVEDDTFVPDPSTKPYDPLTNFLSPRPKFLRYNPTRRRENIVLRQKEEVCSPSPSVSRDSRDVSVYSTAESSMWADRMGANGHSEKLEEEEADEDGEEVEEMMGIRGRRRGLKWELFKSLILLVVLVLCTTYISSMSKAEPGSGMWGLKVDYKEFGNNTFRGVSLRSVEFGSWVFDMREESEISMLEINEIFGAREQGRSLVKTYEWDDDIEDQEVEVGAEKIVSLEGSYRNLSWFGIEDYTNPILESLKNDQEETEVPIIAQDVENEAEMVAPDNIEVTEEGILAGHESTSKDGQLTKAVKFAAENPHLEVIEQNVTDFKGKISEFELTSKDEYLEMGVEIVSEEPFKRNEEENLSDYDKVIVESKPKSEDRSEIVTESSSEEAAEENTFESGQNQFWLNTKIGVWLLIPSVMTWMAVVVVRFYLKCKKASSKTSSSNVKLIIQVEKNRSRLPPKPAVKISQLQKTDALLNPPIVVHSRDERLEMASRRIIPKVEMLGEFVIGGEFRRKTQGNEQSIQSLPEERRMANMAYSSAIPTRSESSEAESSSYGSCVSQKTAKRLDAKEEMNISMTPTPLRRSSRLHNKGVTSP